MIYRELLAEFAEDHPIVLAESDLSVPIVAAIPAQKGTVLRENILYLAQSQEILSSLRPDTSLCNILVPAGIQSIPEVLKSTGLNLCRMECRDDLTYVMDTVARLNAQQARQARAMEVLDQTFFANRGVQSLLDRAGKLLSRPIVQLDFTRTLLFWSSDTTQGFPELTQALTQMRNAAQYPAEIAQLLFDGSIPQQILPSVEHRFHDGFHCGQMTLGLWIRNTPVGIITVFDCGRRFDAVDEAILVHLCALVGQDLQKMSLYARNPSEHKAHILSHLISSPAVSDSYISHMQHLGFLSELKDKFYIAVIGSMEEAAQGEPNLFPDLVLQLQPLLLHGMYLIRDAELVLLFNLPEKTDVHKLADTLLTDRCGKVHLFVGISNIYRDLRETCKHYRQAQRSASLGALYRDHVVNYFSDIAPKEILHFMACHEDLLSFCVPEVLELMEYDQHNGTELMDTLYVYLEHACSSAEAAQALFIHKNTLLYRISKIRDILHCEMKRGEDLYKLMMSMRILWTLMLYTPPHLRSGKQLSAAKRK